MEIIVICWGTLGCSAVLLLVSGILSTLATVKVTKMTKRRKYSLIAMDLIVSVFALASVFVLLFLPLAFQLCSLFF